MNPNEIYTFDDDGQPVPKYYSRLTNDADSPYVEDQETGKYQRDDKSGGMIEVLRDRERRGLADRILGRDDPRKLNERTWIDKAAGVPNTFWRTVDEGAADTLEGVAVAASKLPGAGPANENVIGRTAESLRDRAQMFTVNPNDRRNFLAYQLPQGLTQMGMQMAAGKGLGIKGSAALFSTQAVGREYNAAKQAGASEDQAALAGLLNAPVGALEMLPVASVFRRVNKATGGTLMQGVRRALADGVEGAVEEAIQETISNSLNNKIAQQIYDENRDVLQGSAESMQQGGAVGFVSNLLLSAVTRTRVGMAAARQANAPVEVFAEYIPRPEEVEAVWLSDETGVARREAGVSGPARHYAMPPVQPVGPDRQIGQNVLPEGMGQERMLNGNLRRVAFNDVVQNVPEETGLSKEEEAALPVNVAARNSEIALRQQKSRRAAYESKATKFRRLNKLMDQFDRSMEGMPDSFLETYESEFEKLSKAIEDNNPGRFQELANVLAKKARNIRGRQAKQKNRPQPTEVVNNNRPLTLDDVIDPESEIIPLTPAEEAQLPVNVVGRQQQRRDQAWRDRLDEPVAAARRKLLERVAAQKISQIDHPVARFQSRIMRNRYKGNGKWGVSREGLDADVWEQIPMRFRNNKNGFTIEEAREMLEIGRDEVTDEQGLSADFDGLTLLDMLQVPKIDRQTGEPTMIPMELQQELDMMERYYQPELDRELIKTTPISEVLLRMRGDAPENMPPMLVRPRDLEDGDILRIGEDLYEVQQRGNVKVLQDGQTIPVEEFGESQFEVDGVVPAGHPMHGELKAAYEAMHAEMNAAAATDYDREFAAEQEYRNALAQQAEDLTLEAVTPEELEAEKDRLARQADRRKAEAQLNTVRKGNAGDLGQAALFDDVETDLWAGPSAEAQETGPRSDDLNDWVLLNYPKEYESGRYLDPSSAYNFHKKIWESKGSPNILDEQGNIAQKTAQDVSAEQMVSDGLLQHSGLIQNELRKLGVRPQEMEDMMQEVAMRALDKAESYDPAKAKVQTWLGTVARNVAKNQFAKSTAKMRDSRATVSLQAPVGSDVETSLMDLVPAKDKNRSMNAYKEALAVTPLEGLEADVRNGILRGLGIEDIAAEQGLTPKKVMGILKIIGRKASRELPTEIREADIVYGFKQKNIPENEFERAVRDQLDFFQRLDATPALPYPGAAAAASGMSDIQRRKAALAKAFADPLNPESWKGLLKHGEPASFVIRELVKRPTDLAWPVEGVKINSPKDVMALNMMLRSPYQESLKIMGLNDDNVVLGGVIHSVGILNASMVKVGNLLGQLPPGTTKVVLAHNHPSGNPQPSPEDLKVSRDVQQALNEIGIELVDHVTTDDWRYFSQKESNMVTFTKPVKSTRVPGKVVLPPARSVEDVVGSEPAIPEWSAIDRSRDRFEVWDPDQLRRMGDAMRQGHPDAAFLVGLDTRNQITGVTMFENAASMRADDYLVVKQAMAVQEEAIRFIVMHPDNGSASNLLFDGRKLLDIGKRMDREIMDVTGGVGASLRASGLVAFEPRKIYRSAVSEVREMSAVYRTAKDKAQWAKDQVARYVNARQRGAEYKGPGLESLDPDVEERLQAAKMLERKPWWKRENWRETARAFNRAFPEIGDTDGRLIYELESVNHVAGAAEMISQSALLDITEGMGPGQLELFERILAARDVARSIREGLYEDNPIPFGWKAPEAVDADLANWESQLSDNPEVEQALDRRQRYMGELRRQLVDHKLLPEAVRDEEDYFRRLTLEYMQESQNQERGPKGLRDEKSGFQKRRKGGGDFVLDYLTAEHDVISHALASLQYKEIRDNIQALADKSGELKQQAKERNRVAVHGGEENYLKVRRVLEEVANLKAEEKYMGEPGGMSQEIAILLSSIDDIDVLRPFRGLKARAISIWEQSTGEDFPEGDPNDIMIRSMQGEYGEAAGYAAGQWFSAIQQEEKFIKDSLGREYIRWRGGKIDKRMIPEGYVPYAIKPGHRMFRAMSVSEAVLEDVIEGHRELLQEDVKEVLVSAGAYPEWVIPENLARALRRMENSGAPSGAVDRVIQRGVGRWKGYKLTAPWHFPKYTFNNATGDADFMLALEPRISKYVKQAIQESYSVNIKRKMTPEMEELAMRGVLGGIMRSEIGGIRQAELFSALSGENPGLLNRYMDKVGGFSKFREDILRLAAYRYYQDALARGERPHGASNFEQVESLYQRGDMKEAAMVLARQAMLDYNNPSEVTNYLRSRYIPFATFKLGNLQRYLRLMRNLAKENDVLSQETARAGAVMGVRLARKAVVATAFATLMSALVTAWNRMMFPEEEESLRRNNREGQMILGVGDDGVARTLRIEGSLTAFSNALGMEEAGRKVSELASGEASLGQTLQEVAGDAASDWVNSAVPFTKTLLEAATRQQLWPDMFNPRPVRDRVEHIAGYASANHLYNRISGKPLPEHRQGLKSLQNWIFYSTDLGEMDYWYTRNLVDEYLGNKQGSYISTSKRDNALYYYRKALQFGDYEAQQKYLDQYLEQGGKLQNLTRNLDKRNPLNDLKTNDEKHQFLMQLKPSDRRAYENALKWYKRTMNLSSKDVQIMSEVVKQRQSEGKQVLYK